MYILYSTYTLLLYLPIVDCLHFLEMFAKQILAHAAQLVEYW